MSSSAAKTHPLERLRQVIGDWPEVSERVSHGKPTFWGGKKTFVSFHDNTHGDGRLALWIKSTLDTQEDLVAADPEAFFVPPYVGPSGWIGVRLDRRLSWDMIEDLLEEGYRSVAPSRALALFER